jgi:hypothetical protein
MTRPSVLFVSLTLITASCSHPNSLPGPQDVRVKLSDYRSVQERAQQDSSLALAVAISGGGHRAGNYGIGALAALELIGPPHGLRSEIDYLSTVSGGGLAGGFLTSYEAAEEGLLALNAPRSLTSSFFEACGRTVDEETALCRRDVLRANLEHALWKRMTSLRILFTPLTSGDALETSIDNNILGLRSNGTSLTLGDIFVPRNSDKRVRLPYWVANGTIFENGAIFPFTPDVLSTYGVSEYNHRMKRHRQLSDPFSLPLAVGLKASASFPVVIPSTIVSVKRQPNDKDPTAYLRILDGGLADNLGVLTALDLLRYEPGTRRKVLVVIDAYPGTGFPFSDRDRSERPLSVIRRIGDIGLESWHGKQSTFIPAIAKNENVTVIYLGFDKLLEQLATFSQKDSDPGCARLAAAEPLPDDAQELSDLRDAARSVGTRLQISPERQRLLLRAGRLVILVNCKAILGAISPSSTRAVH